MTHRMVCWGVGPCFFLFPSQALLAQHKTVHGPEASVTGSNLGEVPTSRYMPVFVCISTAAAH